MGCDDQCDSHSIIGLAAAPDSSRNSGVRSDGLFESEQQKQVQPPTRNSVATTAESSLKPPIGCLSADSPGQQPSQAAARHSQAPSGPGQHSQRSPEAQQPAPREA